jgi:amino acid adenylation domain-containing protein
VASRHKRNLDDARNDVGSEAGLSKVTNKTSHQHGGKGGHRVFFCLADLLAYYGRTTPGRDAILAPGHDPLTYGALWARTNEIVRELRNFGIGRADRVAVVLPGGPEAAVATVAVAAGAVCVPLHPGFAAEEWRRYLSDLRVAALLTLPNIESSCRGAAYSGGIPVIDLLPRPGEGPGAFSLVCPVVPPPAMGRLAVGTDDAFILLTSGTTAQPKLVPLTQASVCLSAHNAGAALALEPHDRLLNILPLFHAHGLISGFLTALAAGSSVVCAPRFDAAAFFGWLTEFRPTWYTAVPPIHRALIAAAPRHRRAARRSSLRLVRSASSSLPVNVLRELEALFGAPVIETYGMTEAASQIAANPLERRKLGSVGKPAGAEIAIMDDEGRQLPTGEHGEISLRGPTITRGYDNNDVTTKAAFRDGWFRTGDLGYMDSEGYVFLVGRIKKADVINRGGQKVSPAEVENVLLSHPDVAEAAAFPVTHTRLGEDVAAAVVGRPGGKITSQSLRRFASEYLATFKVPGLIRIVPAIPTGPGGKIIRSELVTALSITSPRTRVERSDKMVAPRSQLEWQLAKIWAGLLELNEVGVDHDVFALGADSLTVAQLLSRLRARFGVGFSFKDIFEAPTVAALAALIESSKREASIAPAGLCDTPTDSHGLLSLQQQRIYILSKLDRIGHKYHVVEIAHLTGRLDLDLLESSIATICERHEALRSIFPERLGEPTQRVTTARLALEHIDLRPLPKPKRAAAIQSQTLRLLRQSFDIEREPPIRVQLLRLDEDSNALVIKLHHLITDGRSQRLFWEELDTLYNARSKGLPPKLPELPVQYQHFVEWQRAWLRTPAAEEQLGYWRGRLEGVTELPLRTDRPRPETWTGRGARFPLKLSRTLSSGIKSLSRTHNATLFMTVLAAFQCLLFRYTQHDDIAVGSLIANRNLIEIERLIGMFANAIVLRTDLSGDPSFSEVLRRVRQITLDAYRNQDLPIEEILRALHVSRSLDQNPLFRVMFLLQKASSKVFTLNGLSTHFGGLDPGVARSDLLLELIDADGSLQGWLEYSTDLFEAATIARMAAHFRKLLESIVANPEEQISCLSLLPERERKQVLMDWNHTRTRFSRRLSSFSERFARQVECSPDAIAVSIGRVRLSYVDLARRAAAIADWLCLEKVGRDEVVVLLAERGIDLLAAMIAVQQAGGAFLPIDPMIPATRQAQIIQHSGTHIVLTTQGHVATLKVTLSGLRRPPRVLILEKLHSAMHRDCTVAVRPASSNLACVIYTSGSTGAPKGAMIEERGLFNHLLSKISDLDLSASDVVAQTSPQSFVISVWQFLAPLMIGARVHICADEEVRDPPLLMKEISREGITVLEIVPTLLRRILQPRPSEFAILALGGLRSLISTGETLAPDLCRDWFRYFPNVPLINAYGATECSDDVATYRLTEPPTSIASVPIGHAIANTQLYVMDRHLRPVPIGIVGELYVGGISVGRGYLNDFGQTHRSFLRDPFSKRRGARLYRTGDLARWRADGMLDCFGRIDNQVKIRGCRIELGEIEYVLLEHPEVRSAVVLARNNTGGETHLIAYIVAATDSWPKANELRDFLKTRLPAHMIPSGYFFTDHMPVTTHGKVDRPALAALGSTLRLADSEFVAPRNSTEAVLAGIWANLLEAKEVGVFSNFFDLGGHSLLAGRVLARVANVFRVSLPIRALFEASTVEALARRIDEARATQEKEPRLAIAEAEGQSPSLSIAQEHMFRIERDLPGLPQFNLPFACRLQGPLNVPALERSLAEVVRRHDSLRTAFAFPNELPVAVVATASAIDSYLIVEDLTVGIPVGNRRAKALLLKKAELQLEREAWTSFDITRAPLFRAHLLRLGPDDHVLLLILHHIVFDGWSIGVFFEEMSEVYSSLVAGQQTQLPEQAPQFSQFANWQRWWCSTDSAIRQIAYWKDYVREALPIFPMDGNPASALLGSGVAHEPVHLPKDLIERLRALSRSQGGTLFMTLLAGFKAMLLARTGRGDICVCTAMANRNQHWTERVIGPMENTTLIRTRMDSDLPFREAISRVRESVLEVYARQELPFEILAAKLAEEAGTDPASLIQVFFVLQNAIRSPLKLSDVAVRPFGDANREGQPVLPIDRTWLTLILKERGSGIGGSCSYKDDLFEANTLRHWMEHYKAILAKGARNPDMSLRRLADQ